MSDRLVLVRHGLTEWNRDGRFQGRLNPRLSPEGRSQAQALASRLADDAARRPVRIVSSPLSRALETAEVILGALSLPQEALATDARLMELGQGEWEGHTHDELRVRDAARYQAWRTGAWNRHPPGGEPVSQATERVQAALAQATGEADAAGAWPLCLVGHGGSLRLVAHVLLDLEIERAWSLDVDNASLSIVDREAGGWRLVTWNDTGHLLGRPTAHAGEPEEGLLTL